MNEQERYLTKVSMLKGISSRKKYLLAALGGAAGVTGINTLLNPGTAIRDVSDTVGDVYGTLGRTPEEKALKRQRLNRRYRSWDRLRDKSKDWVNF